MSSRWPTGTIVHKPFEIDGKPELFQGQVIGYLPEEQWWHVKYEDGDEEHLEEHEMEQFAESVEEVAVSSRGRRRKRISYNEDVNETDSDTEAERIVPLPRKKAKTSKKNLDDESDSFEATEEEDEEEEDFEDGDLAISDNDDEVDDEEGRPKKKKGKAKRKSGTSMAEAFKPLNNPLYWRLSLEEIQKKHEYLDPCGMEATDDIIDHLVGEQVTKIGKLLSRALKKDSKFIGSAKNPLRLGTACSGTDAPALAMTIVQEQMARFGFAEEFNYEHIFSCEKEPFKQSYLARNFDSILYPDIVKLTDAKPRDVYGQEKEMPPFNMFVAGTSCKNFSMLHSTKRMDIEDKGCSGETFLAAIEALFKEQPSFAIFENVTGAPWAKMQEYISGRVKLSTVNDMHKKIASTNETKDRQIKQLTFIREKTGIYAKDIPLQVGVRCGSVVKGFLKAGSSNLHSITWPNGKSKTCTLSELVKVNELSMVKDTLVFDNGVTYCTCIQKVDTKNYGLPQTRERTYMFVWKPADQADYDDDLGVYWKAIVKFLENPVRHSLEAFILDTDHDNIRVFREALNGPPGRHTKRSVFQAPDFWTSGNANVKHNKIARSKSGIKEFARPNVGGGARGKKQIPPHYWLEYLDLVNQRSLDALDVLHISGARDAEAHDSNFSSFSWNISQNVSKEKHRTATPGIASCISPGGEFFVSNLGRPLLGCEKLLLQGIPYFRLALGSESEVELGDLAGNAMSLTVVCATMLAAISCGQLRAETIGESPKDLPRILKKSASIENQKTIVVPKSAPISKNATDVSESFKNLADIASEAVESSIWCTCESSGRNSISRSFLFCRMCRVSCCTACVRSHSGYQISSHEMVDHNLTDCSHSQATFLSKLRNIAPPSLTFHDDGIKSLADLNANKHRVSDLSKFSFTLQKVQRERRKWLLHYNARDYNGVGEVVAEFKITVGEIWTESMSQTGKPKLGVKGELLSYFPAKTPPLIPGKLEPCAVIITEKGRTSKAEWMGRNGNTPITLDVVGEKPSPSWLVELGLTDEAAKQLKLNATKGAQRKHFEKARSRQEERRWIYPSNWKAWPDEISVSSKVAVEVSGFYARATCRQTANQSAIWIRKGHNEETLYLILKPNVGRTGPDTAVISKSISHTDSTAILVHLPPYWQPCDALNDKKHRLECTKTVWTPALKVSCQIRESGIFIERLKDETSLLHLKGLTHEEVNMLYPFKAGETASDPKSLLLNVHNGIQAQKTIRAFNYICVPPIMRFAAVSGELSVDLSPGAPWRTLKVPPASKKFGRCDKIIPKRPAELWMYDNEREAWTRKSEPGASRRYYLQLQEAEKPFSFVLNKTDRVLSIECSPNVTAHHAARFLIEGRDEGCIEDEINVRYRLSDTAQQLDPSYSPFKVFRCRDELPTKVELKPPYQLYERQQKVVTKMLLIESGKVKFEELEMVEHDLPGSTGFSLIAKASRQRRISGGVIADAIGAGKTVISISIILQGLMTARQGQCFPRKSGASLVVVPSGLIHQWRDEIRKFTSNISVICIHDMADLEETSVCDLIKADVIIAPVDLLEAKGYVANLAWKSGLTESDIPALPKGMGYIERPGARGVWIPAASRDPYGTGSMNEMKYQILREQSAYYTHAYQDSVVKLREHVFNEDEKGVPLEYFEWERIIVDEIHECLCTDKDNLQLDWFKEKNRRASRELLGITEKDWSKRPLVYRKSILGLTGTPLLDNSDRVIELANLIGSTYIIGLASHWRKLERESRRDIFLQLHLEPKQSREIRKAIYSKCQEYLETACCRNTTEQELEGIERVESSVKVAMTEEEKERYIASQSGIDSDKKGLDVRPENFDPSAGHDISKFLKENANLQSRGAALCSTCQSILKDNPTTKIIVFADGRIGAGQYAREYLEESGLGCTWLGEGDSVATKNKKISYYQRADATDEDRKRPRILLLHFDHAAGLNLQKECNNLILFSPLYVGDGGVTSDPVADASTEQQAIGRVFRPGQLRAKVYIHRIEVQGPNGEECLDGYLIRRNTEKETLEARTNASDE